MPASISAVATIFGVSAGSVIKRTKSFIGAVNKLADRCIMWPSEGPRAERALLAREKFGFWGCIGSVNGSQVSLAYAPRVQPRTFWDRHDRYSIHVLAVSDHDHSSISVTLGFSGSASDAMVQQQADWARFPGEHLSLGELFLGDKGMHYTNRAVGPHIEQSGQTTSNQNLNWQLARLRVISEHTFGIEKGRWASLKELRLPIGFEADLLAAPLRK